MVGVNELRLHHDVAALFYVGVSIWMMLPVLLIKQ
jgi:hypothetical protein